MSQGWLDVDAMLGSMTSEQLSEWQVFTRHFQALPNSPREAASIVAALLQVVSGSKKTTDDFDPVAPIRPAQSAEDGMRAMRAIASRNADR